VHENDIGVAPSSKVERLPGAERDDVDLDPRLLLEARQQMREESGLLSRSR
jgi:hypothetical protein